MRVISGLALIGLVACNETPMESNRARFDFAPGGSPISFEKTVVTGPFTSQIRVMTYTILSQDSLDGEVHLNVEAKDSLIEALAGTNPPRLSKVVGKVIISPDTVLVDSVLNVIISGPAGAISPWFPVRDDFEARLPGFCSLGASEDSLHCSYFSSAGSTSYRQVGTWKSGLGLTYAEKGYFSPGGSSQEYYRRL